MGLPFICLLQRPVPVRMTTRLDDLDGVRKALVSRSDNALQVVQSAKDVEMPAGREGELSELFAHRLSGAMGLVKVMKE